MAKTKILYIDSEKEFASHTLSNLINANYDVLYSKNIKQALISYSLEKPEIIICDSIINDKNSFEFLKKLKLKTKNLFIIILTNENNQKLFLNAIDLKIDKLLFKNCTFEELDKIIKTYPLSKNEQKNELFNLGKEFYYDKNANKIIRNSQNIHLTIQENNLISELIKSQGNFISNIALQSIISREEVSSIDTLRTIIRRIRNKTYKDIIKNKSGIGYKINYLNSENNHKKYHIDKIIKLNIKVLLIKGIKEKTDILKFQLEKLGFFCESCYTLKDAKMLINNEKFDYIITDLSLPDGESIDFIREVSNSKFIVLSELEDMHYKEYLYFKGIIDYIIDIKDINYLAYNIYKTIYTIETNTTSNNILIIDKSKRICEQIKDLLQPRNYNVSSLNDLSHAYEVLKTKHFSLVILDINIENNFNFLHKVKSTIDELTSFIVLTDSNKTYNILRETYKNGATETLTKPIFAEEFILKVDQIIEHSKLVSELMHEKELLQSYKTTIDKSAIISKTNKEGIITYVNDSFCKASGYSREELIGQNHNIVRHPGTPQELFEDLWNTISKEKRIWTGIIKNKTKHNEKYILQTSIMPIVDTSNNITEYIALRNNITNISKERA
jgi:PAS domain S-box-containing protein